MFQDNLGITLILESYFIHPQTFFTNDTQLHETSRSKNIVLKKDVTILRMTTLEGIRE